MSVNGVLVGFVTSAASVAEIRMFPDWSFEKRLQQVIKGVCFVSRRGFVSSAAFVAEIRKFPDWSFEKRLQQVIKGVCFVSRRGP